MGSSATLVKQAALFILLTAFVAWAAPAEAKAWVVVVGAGSLGLFLALSLYRHAQIKRLAAEIDEVLHNGRRISFSNSHEGDVAILSNELEKMVARLARTSEQLAAERNGLADALADVSHQIRTPLTAITLMLPSVERAEDPQERKRMARRLEGMIERVSWLVTTLLKMAKIDAGAIHVERKQVLCTDVVKRALAPLELALDLHDITLHVSLEEGASFTGDALWTAEALENIVKNCMEHTPPGGMIAVSAREDVLATTLEIADTGPGISSVDLPHVFDRFYRGREDKRTAETGGFGIGLSLAQALISAQGGTIRVANDPEAGARFAIAFPKLEV